MAGIEARADECQVFGKVSAAYEGDAKAELDIVTTDVGIRGIGIECPGHPCAGRGLYADRSYEVAKHTELDQVINVDE